MFPFLRCLAVPRRTENVHKHLAANSAQCWEGTFPLLSVKTSQSSLRCLSTCIPFSIHGWIVSPDAITGSWTIASLFASAVCPVAVPYAFRPGGHAQRCLWAGLGWFTLWGGSLSFNGTPTKTTAGRSWSELAEIFSLKKAKKCSGCFLPLQKGCPTLLIGGQYKGKRQQTQVVAGEFFL